MWADVGTWALVAALVWVLFLFIRHGKRLAELNAEDRTMAEEREQVDARLIYQGETGGQCDDCGKFVAERVDDKCDDCRGPGVRMPAIHVDRGSADYLKAKTMAQQTIAAVAGDWDAPTVVTAKQDLTVAIVAENVRTIERPKERRRLATVEDELGVWTPSAHQVAQPEILGDVLAWRKWKTIRPAHLGMVTV